MKRLASISALTLGLFVTSGLTSAYAGIQDFVVRNFSSNTVLFVYVSADYESSWGADVLGSNVLYPGQEIEVYMDGYGSHCWFDIKVEDEAGYYQEYFGVDLCSVYYIDY